MKKFRTTLKNVMFLLRPGFRYGKVYFLLLMVMTVLPALSSALVSVSTPKIAIDGLMQGAPVLRIIRDIGLLLLLQFAVSAIGTVVARFSAARTSSFSVQFSRLIMEQSTITDYRYLDRPEYYSKFQMAYQNYSSGAMDAFNGVVSAIEALLSCAAMFAVISTLGLWIVPIVVAGTVVQTVLNARETVVNGQASREVMQNSLRMNYGMRMFGERQYAEDLKAGNIKQSILAWIDWFMGLLTDIYRKYRLPQCLLQIGRTLASQLTTLGTIAYIVVGISRGRIGSIGDYAALLTASTILTNKVENIFLICNKLISLSVQAGQAREFFDLPSVIENSRGAMPPDTPFAVELQDVSFAYPDSDFALKHISMKIAPGEKIAIVGENGVGKSTLTKLLLRLYDVDSGRICYNGEPCAHWDVHELRRRIGIAFQSTNVYAVSLRENLKYYHPEASDEVRLEALRRVGLERLNDLDEVVSREFIGTGFMLSGGEIQKLALARLLVGDFGLMVLDEPSSALDPLAEYEMTKLMFNASKTTTIMVAHRLSTIRDADRIYLISDGEIAEQGTHEELMALGGKYCEMFTKQGENYLR